MNSKTDNHWKSKIDLPSSRNENIQPPRLIAQWNQMWESLLYHLFKEKEPQVRQRRDRHGNLWWVAYDPASGQSFSCATEDDVRIWLEQVRYR